MKISGRFGERNERNLSSDICYVRPSQSQIIAEMRLKTARPNAARLVGAANKTHRLAKAARYNFHWNCRRSESPTAPKVFSFDLSADFFRSPRHTPVIDRLSQPLFINKTQQTPIGRAIKQLSLNH
jgi:hypothetical protein